MGSLSARDSRGGNGGTPVLNQGRPEHSPAQAGAAAVSAPGGTTQGPAPPAGEGVRARGPRVDCPGRRRGSCFKAVTGPFIGQPLSSGNAPSRPNPQTQGPYLQ